MAITDLLTLPTSGRYSAPQGTNEILPLVYGDMTENSSQGAWVAPCIDTNNYVYCVSGWPVQTVSGGNTVKVYIDNELQSSGYTFDESNDYESLGEIAIVTFVSEPTGTVTVACSGKPDSTDTLLTNPIDIIEDLLDYAADTGDLILPDNHEPAFALAKSVASEKSYTCAGVILSENSPAFWLTAILGSFAGQWWLRNDGKITLRFDTDIVNTFIIAGSILERNHITCSGSQRVKNLINRIIINYAISYTDIDNRFREGVDPNYFKTDDGSTTEDTLSQAKFGIRYPLQALNFDWTRNTATVQEVSQRLIDRYAEPTWIYDVQEQGVTNIHVEKGDMMLFSWEERLDENALPLVNQICQVLSKDIDLDEETIMWELIDMKEWYPGDVDLWNGTDADTGDGGTFGGDRDRRVG